MTAGLEHAGSADVAAIRELLMAAALPVDDLETAPLQFWVWRDGLAVVGAVALERYGATALIRSLVVAPGHRKRGIGEALVGGLEQNARAAGVALLVLLTQSAERFFAGRGYEVTERALISGAIQECAEFKSLCPTSAVCMTKALN